MNYSKLIIIAATLSLSGCACTKSESNYGSILIYTKGDMPADVRVYIDSSFVGSLDDTNYNLKAGSHQIVIKALGFEDYKEEVTVIGDSSKQSISYTPKPIQENAKIVSQDHPAIDSSKKLPIDLSKIQFEKIDTAKFVAIASFYKNKPIEIVVKLLNSETIKGKAKDNEFSININSDRDQNEIDVDIIGVVNEKLYGKYVEFMKAGKPVLIKGIGLGLNQDRAYIQILDFEEIK